MTDEQCRIIMEKLVDMHKEMELINEHLGVIVRAIRKVTG